MAFNRYCLVATLLAMTFLVGLVAWGCSSAAISTTSPASPTAPTNSPTISTASPTASTPPPTTSATSAINATPIFQQNCSPCHGADRKGIVGPDITAAGLQSRGRSDQYIRDTVTNGRNGMPSWKDKLTPAQLDALVKFLRT